MVTRHGDPQVDANRSETRPVTPRLVVIDDDKDAVERLVEALETMGFEVHGATRGQDGIAIASDRYPHLVLLDLWLSDKDGFAVASALLENVPAPKLVALSEHVHADMVQKTRAAGFAAHLPKPVDLELLRETIHALVPSSSLAL